MFENLSEKFDRAFKVLKGQGQITEINVAETLKEVRRALLDADVNYKTAKEFTAKTKERALGQNVLSSVSPGQLLTKICHEELVLLMGGEQTEINFKGNPGIILMAGLQGSGKTTHSGKLALWLKDKQKKTPLLVACDVYRPAAIDQLHVLGEQLGVEVYSNREEKNPVKIAAEKTNSTPNNVDHIYFVVMAKNKYEVLKRIADSNPNIYGIVFCRTRNETKDIVNKLIQDGYNADALHGELSQSQRDEVMLRFRQNKLQMLVATDVAARGLDVDNLTHIINYNMPDDMEVYIHRSGRTGRAGKNGISMSIIHTREVFKIKDIEKEKVSIEQNSTSMQDDLLNEISLDSLGYIENTEQNNQEENQQQTDIVQSVNQEENEKTTPQLFSEEEDVDFFKQEVNPEKESESLIHEDEEEEFEIPAFLRKQKINE